MCYFKVYPKCVRTVCNITHQDLAEVTNSLDIEHEGKKWASSINGFRIQLKEHVFVSTKTIVKKHR